MKSFKLFDEDTQSVVSYYVLRCPNCKGVFRHDIAITHGGKALKKRLCQVCGQMVEINETNCLDADPFSKKYDEGFKRADEV